MTSKATSLLSQHAFRAVQAALSQESHDNDVL
jgi:hypothetical protein